MKDLTDYSVGELRHALRVKRDQYALSELEAGIKTLTTNLWEYSQAEKEFAGAKNDALWDAISSTAAYVLDLNTTIANTLKLINAQNNPKAIEPAQDVEERLKGC